MKRWKRGMTKTWDKKNMIFSDNTGLSKSPGFLWALEKEEKKNLCLQISNKIVGVRVILSSEWQLFNLSMQTY